MDRKKEYVDKMEAQLKVWDAELQTLAAKAEKARAEAKADLNEQIKRLRAKHAETKTKLDELRGKSEGAWVDVKDGIEKAWRELKTGIDKAVMKFK